MALCQSHTKSGAVECMSNKLLNTDLYKQYKASRLLHSASDDALKKCPNMFDKLITLQNIY